MSGVAQSDVEWMVPWEHPCRQYSDRPAIFLWPDEISNLKGRVPQSDWLGLWELAGRLANDPGHGRLVLVFVEGGYYWREDLRGSDESVFHLAFRVT